MAACVGIIAEYNPFHNGHLHQLARAKELSDCAHAIVAMSGSFTQRGEPACADKFTRARWALENGADLVVELPTLFSMAGAERFARGGVALLGASGIAEALSFGAEDADIGTLRALASLTALEGGALKQRLGAHLAAGKSFPAARAAALADAHGGEAIRAALLSPNNILAFEYIKAIDMLYPGMRPVPVRRQGAAHDADAPAGGFASASSLRAALGRSDAEFLGAFAPKNVSEDCARLLASGDMPCTADALSDAFLYALRRLPSRELAKLPDVAEGLENAIYREARARTRYEGVLAAIKSKRYTLARLRRILSCALLGITKEKLRANPAPRYIRVLGARKDSLGLLSRLAGSASLPIVTCKADYDRLGDEARAMLDLDLFAAEVLAMAAPKPRAAEYEFARPLTIV